jgi:hypothetical protein
MGNMYESVFTSSWNSQKYEIKISQFNLLHLSDDSIRIATKRCRLWTYRSRKPIIKNDWLTIIIKLPLSIFVLRFNRNSITLLRFDRLQLEYVLINVNSTE